MAEEPTVPPPGSGVNSGDAKAPPKDSPPGAAPDLGVGTAAGSFRVQLGEASEVKPEQPDVSPVKSENTYVGFALAKIFSSILACYLVLACLSIWYSESRMLAKMDSLTQGLTLSELRSMAGQTNGITKDELSAWTKSVSEAYRETRSTTIEFHKTIIVNVLFPILTALLGYIFANRERNDPNQNGK